MAFHVAYLCGLVTLGIICAGLTSACSRNNGIHCLIAADRTSATDRIWDCNKCGPYNTEKCTEDRYIWDASRVLRSEARCDTHCCMCQRFDGRFTPCIASQDIRDDVELFTNPNPFPFAPCGWCPVANPAKKLTCRRQGCFTNATTTDGELFTFPRAQNNCANGPCDAIVRLKKF